MSYAVWDDVTVTTDGSGDATEYSAHLTGRVINVVYTKTDFADGVDFTITCEKSGVSLWTDANINASETVAPVQALNKGADGAAASDPAYGPIYLANERVKIVVASGGDTKSGTFTIVVA